MFQQLFFKNCREKSLNENRGDFGFSFVLIAALVLVLSWPAFAQAQESALFSTRGTQRSSSAALPPWVSAKRAVSVSADALSNSREFPVDLFGRQVTADQGAPLARASVRALRNVSQTTRGVLREKGARVGEFTVTRVTTPDADTAVYGQFSTDDGKIYILRDSDEGEVFEALDGTGFPDCANDDHPEVADVPEGTPQRRSLPMIALDTVTIDVLVAYTPATSSALGGDAQAEALIATAVSLANQAYTDSNAGLQLNLAATHKLSTNTSGSFSTDIDRARTDGDGTWDELHTLREQYGADLVSVIVTNTQYCGVGYLLNPDYPSAALGFSVVYHGCATGYYSFAHELGHNMGLAHDVSNAGGSGAFAYSHGFHFDSNTKRTIMAYSPGTRIGRFSNPDLMYAGFATGSAPEADNARTLDETASLVAAFMESTGASVGGGSGNEEGGGSQEGGSEGGSSGGSNSGGGGSEGGESSGAPSGLTLELRKTRKNWDAHASATSGSLAVEALLYCAEVDRRGNLASGYDLVSSTTLSESGFGRFYGTTASKGISCLATAESADGTVQSNVKTLKKKRRQGRSRKGRKNRRRR